VLDEWRRRGVEVVFLNRPLGQSPEDDLLLQVQGIVAEYERAKIMERSRRGKKHAAQSGSLNVMSGAPFGYRYVSVREGDGQARFEPVSFGVKSPISPKFSWVGNLSAFACQHQPSARISAMNRQIEDLERDLSRLSCLKIGTERSRWIAKTFQEWLDRGII
jgi:hypothetical protein